MAEVQETENNVTPGADEQTAADGAVETTDATQESPPVEGAGGSGERNEFPDLPDWAQKQIRDLRRESSNYRTQLNAERENREQFESRVSELSEQLAAKDLDLVRERVGGTYGLPADLRSRLEGATEEEVEADAKKLAALFQASSTGSQGPSGGLNANAKPPVSPEDLAAQARAQRH